MKISCVALDLDRTTLNREGKLGDANKKAIEELIGKGICVVIASGRSFHTLPTDVVRIPRIYMRLPPMGRRFTGYRTAYA